MGMIAFLHTPHHVKQSGRVHFIHYHCSITPANINQVIHHHDLLPRLKDLDSILPIPKPDDKDAWIMQAEDWQRLFLNKEIPLLNPGQLLAPSATE